MLPDPFPPPRNHTQASMATKEGLWGEGQLNRAPTQALGRGGGEARNSLSSLQNYLGGKVEGERLLCPWAQPPGLIPHTNQARGTSLSPTFPQTGLLTPCPVSL